MRIIAGEWKGRTIQAPKGQETRPTGDRVRESIFSRLNAEFGDFDDLVVLDAFGGSGAFAFEALSRGASRAVVSEQAPAAREVILRNAQALQAHDRFVLVAGDTLNNKALQLRGPYDIVFIDPPYAVDSNIVSDWLDALGRAGAIAHNASIVYEHGRGTIVQWPAGFIPAAIKQYGQTTVSYADYQGEQ